MKRIHANIGVGFMDGDGSQRERESQVISKINTVGPELAKVNISHYEPSSRKRKKKEKFSWGLWPSLAARPVRK